MGKKIIVIGGGIVGCMTARELANHGHHVTVVERNIIAAQTSGEASWAGAGILFPLLPWFYKDEVNAISLAGAVRYPEICAQLLTETGIDPECINSGMRIKPPFDAHTALSWCARNNVTAELESDDLLLPNVCQVRNPRLMQALKQSLIQNGVTLIEQTQLVPLDETELEKTGKVTGWKTSPTSKNGGTVLEADVYVVTSGAWSFELLKNTAAQLDIKPMRGQILLYQTPTDAIPHIIYQDGFYLVPRRDGYLLAGSTLEDVGFDTGITKTAHQEIQAKAEAILPQLKDAPILKHWSGLRPGTPDNMPTIARHPTIENLYLNTGHFRYGVTMAPESAKKLTNLIG